MIRFDEQYLVDETGNRKAVVVPITAWEQILEALDELEDIRSYDAAKQGVSEPIPFEQAVLQLREGMPD
jgi:hypothetical protein